MRNLPGGDASDVDHDAGVVATEGLKERQQRVYARFICGNHHAALLHIAQFLNAGRRFFDEPQDALGVRQQEVASVRQRAVSRRSVDQPFPGPLFESPDRLADRRLRAAQLPGGSRKASFRGDRGKDPEILNRHAHKNN